MDARRVLGRLISRSAPERVVVKDYGRDSLLVWANLLIAPVLALLGLRVGLQSEEQIAARIEAGSTAMRKRGYLVSSVQTFSLPVVGSRAASANWYRVTYQLGAAQTGDAADRGAGS